MQPNLTEYIVALRKFNPGISDTEIKEYLLTVGYKPEELASAFGRIYSEALNQAEIVSSMPKVVPPETPHITPPVSTVETTSADPYRQSILSGDNFSLETKNVPPVSFVPKTAVHTNEVLSQPVPSVDSVVATGPVRSYPGMGNFNQNTQYKVPSSVGYTNPDWKEPKVKSPWVTLLVWLFVFAFAGGISFVYMKYVHGIYVFVKPPFSRENFLEDFLSKSSLLKTANQKMSVQFTVTEQDPDAVTFKRSVEAEETLAPYKRDEDRLRDVSFLLDTLGELRDTKKPYPSTLSEIGLPASDAQGNPYQYKVISINKVSTPEIKVAFETPEALDIAKKSGGIALGKQVTFTNDSLYGYFLRDKVEPKALGNLMFFKELEDSVSFLPIGTEASFSVTNSYEKTDGALPENTNSNIQVGVKSDVFTFDVDVDLRKIAKDIFLKVNKAPTIFMDFSKVKNQWVHLTSENVSDTALPGIGDILKDQESIEKILPQMKKIISVAGEEGVVELVGDASKTKQGNEVIFNYQITLNKEAFKKFYERVSKELSDEYKSDSLLAYDESVLEALRSKEFDSLWDYFFRNTTIYVVANKDGLPLSMEFATRFVPYDDQVQNKKNSKQVNIKISLENKDINQVVVVDTPKDHMSFKDAFILVQGISAIEYDFSEQEKNLSAVGLALDTYKKMTGVYPDTLDMLSMKSDEIRKNSQGKSINFSKDFDVKMPLIVSLPSDVFTKSKFIYKRVLPQGKLGEDFTLTYTMNIPPFMDSLVNPFEERSGKVGLKYVSGSNTATSKTLSLEAGKSLLIDTDKDGLSDSFELYIGTNKSLKDTDKDGFTDFKEFKDATNPIGPGFSTRSYFYNSSF